MASIEVGRVCIKTAGREAGKKCVILDIVDKNFVEIVGISIKNRRCNINHLEPTDKTLEVSDDLSIVKRSLETL